MNKIKSFLLNENFILCLIILNTILLFFTISPIIILLDNVINIFYILELILKIYTQSFKIYIKDNFNKFDFILILSILPGIFIPSLQFLIIFRILRIFKIFKTFKYEKFTHILTGLKLALKSSIIIFIAFFIYIFTISNISHQFYNDTKYFNTIPESIYSTFKLFTIEGWYSIPDEITINKSDTYIFLTKTYFIFIVLTGGVFGMSIVNSIFVDAMVSDNNKELERKIDELSSKIDKLIK